MSGLIELLSAILQALMKGESYGLEIIERVQAMSGGKIKILQGRVYPVLRELETDGLLCSFDGQPLTERGGRPRRYYELTAEGRRVATCEANAIAEGRTATSAAPTCTKRSSHSAAS